MGKHSGKDQPETPASEHPFGTRHGASTRDQLDTCKCGRLIGNHPGGKPCN